MQFQKQNQKLQQIASSIYKHILALQQLTHKKRAFLQKINFNISSLFALITLNQTVTIKQLIEVFDASLIRILVHNKKYLTLQDLQRYFDTKSTNYDKSNRNSILKETPNNSKQKPLQISLKYEFQQILSKQLEIMQSIEEQLKQQSSEILFNQIDFFNNGYIDSSSFMEFVRHYTQHSSKNICFDSNGNIDNGEIWQDMELNFGKVIKYLKCSATAQKIFYADLLIILQNNSLAREQSNNPQLMSNTSVFNYINNKYHCYSNNGSLKTSIYDLEIQKKAKINKEQRVYFNEKIYNERKNSFIDVNLMDTNNLQQQQQSQQQLQLQLQQQQQQQKQYQQQKQQKNEQNPKANISDIQKMNKLVRQEMKQIRYEQRICNIHERNSKYLQKLKNKMSINYIKQIASNIETSQLQKNKKSKLPNNHHSLKAKQLYSYSFNPASQLPYLSSLQKINHSQIIYQLRYLSQLYDKFRIQIQKIINSNKKFTFCNAFNVIDINDHGYITYKQLKNFLQKSQIILNQIKIQNIFNILSQKKQPQNQLVIYYYKFVLKLFKLKIVDKLYQNCRKRKPLLSYYWSQIQQINYCRFLRQIINIFYEIKVNKNNLIKMFKIKQIQCAADLLNVQQKKYYNIVEEIRQKMQQIFNQNDIHRDKLAQILGKNSTTFITELYGDQVLLQPEFFINFITKII